MDSSEPPTAPSISPPEENTRPPILHELTMESSEPPTGRLSPRQELRGPRPARVKARKDPYKIKKTPAAPPPPQHRPPVIIYTEPPRVIHTTPSNFMSLVQRLTGASSSSSSSSSSSANAAASRSLSNAITVGETVPSAARVAAIEKGASTSHDEEPRKNGEDVIDQLGIDGGAPDFFSPSMDPNFLNPLHEPSPAFDGNRNFVENTFLDSPNNLLTTPAEPSPAGYWDPFYQDFDQFDP